MLKLFKKKTKIPEDVPQIITAQSVLVVNGEDVYVTNDIIKVTTYDGETYVGRLERVNHDITWVIEPYISLDISAEFNNCTKLIDIKDIKSIEPVEEES